MQKSTQIYFISGIDTDAGKTIVTGLFYKYLLSKNIKAITVKAAQTGCQNISDDIIEHRRIAGIELLPEDKAGQTCPYLFNHPCSPHLSARLENKIIDTKKIADTVFNLTPNYDVILLEGAGGLIVPLTGNYTSADFIKDYHLPVILVTSSRLGSVNHTLLSLEYMRNNNIKLAALVYNEYPAKDKFIAEDSYNIFSNYLSKYFSESPLIRVPDININPNQTGEWEKLIIV